MYKEIDDITALDNDKLCNIAKDSKLILGYISNWNLYYHTLSLTLLEYDFIENNGLNNNSYAGLEIKKAGGYFNYSLETLDTLTEFQKSMKARFEESLKLKYASDISDISPGDIGVTSNAQTYLYLGHSKGKINLLNLNNNSLGVYRSSKKEHYYLLLDNAVSKVIVSKTKKKFRRIISNPFSFFYKNDIPLKMFKLDLGTYCVDSSLLKKFTSDIPNMSDFLSNVDRNVTSIDIQL